MTDIIQMSKGGTKFYPQTHVQAVLGLPDYSSFEKSSDVQTAISTAISPLQTQVNNSAVGTNLLLKTYKPFSMTGNNTLNQWLQMYALSRRLEKGTTVTLSFDVVSTASVRFAIQNNNDGVSDGGTWAYYINDTVGTTKKHCVSTITLNGYAQQGINIKLDYVPSTTTITISNMKLELGSHATDWCPNPSEILTKGDAIINVISQADYDKLTDKTGVYFIEG